MEIGLVALWLVVYLALLYAGGAVAAVLFPRFADRGLGVAVPLALAVVWLVTYLVGRVSLTFGIWLGVLVLVALAALAGARGVSVDRRRYVETAGVFTLAFCFLIAIRAVDPAIVSLGGEKFLDFGLLQSLVRGDTLPPEDMWFAGEPVAYYYGGHLIAAILTRITGTAPQYAYNLALAGFYAMLVTAVYGLAGSVAADRGISRPVAGTAGAFLVGIASNLSTPGRFVLWLLPDGVSGPLAERLGVEIDGLAAGPDQFSYWDASRVIQDDPADFATMDLGAAYIIDEFPLFAWLNGDMHAHMMSTSFTVLVAAVCYAYYATPAESVRRRRALLLGVLPPLAALIGVTNTWSFPTVGGLAMLTVALSPADPRTLFPTVAAERLRGGAWREELSRILAGVGVAVAVLAVGLVWSLPFWLGAASGREIAVLPDRASLGELLLVHGAFVAAFAPYLYYRAAATVDRDTVRIGALLTVAVIGAAAAWDLAALGLFGPLVVGGWLLVRDPDLRDTGSSTPARSDGGDSAHDRDAVVGFETILMIAGAGLVVLVEFVFLAEPTGRMNTVFKVYMQTWVLWAVAGGAALGYLLDRWTLSSARGWRPALGQVAVVFLLLSTSLYAGLALSDHFGSQADIARTDDPTLDGRAWLDIRHSSEGQAIRWLDENVEGQPAMVTAAPGGYQWDPPAGEGASALASLTGIPTVLGWHHEAQYRGDEVYQERLGDVETIYTGEPAAQTELLREYDVQYVYVGPAERNRYGEITVDDVRGVEPLERWDDVTIYAVDQDAVAAS